MCTRRLRRIHQGHEGAEGEGNVLYLVLDMVLPDVYNFQASPPGVRTRSRQHQIRLDSFRCNAF